MKKNRRFYSLRNNKRNADSRTKKKVSRKPERISSLTKFVLAVMVAAAVICIILFSNKNVTIAEETGDAPVLTKYYKSITIASGDTLWSIANEYKSGDYRSTRDYVEELRSMNGLCSDKIDAGQKLVVAYFAP